MHASCNFVLHRCAVDCKFYWPSIQVDTAGPGAMRCWHLYSWTHKVVWHSLCNGEPMQDTAPEMVQSLATLAAVWHDPHSCIENSQQTDAVDYRQSVSASTVGAECSSPTYNRHQAKRPHYASTQRAPLASHASACRFQAGGVVVLVYKALHDLTAPYLVDDCQFIVFNVSRRGLRSADIDTCIVPRTDTRLGDRNFAVAGPRLWNSLPAELRQPDIKLGEFRRLLKTFLFTWDIGA